MVDDKATKKENLLHGSSIAQRGPKVRTSSEAFWNSLSERSEFEFLRRNGS